MNWGVKIFIAFVVFGIAVISVVIFLVNQKVDMVTDNYYEKELLYQDQINKIERTRAYKKPLIEFTGNEIVIKYPNKPSLNEKTDFVLFYRPSDKNMDIKLPVNIDSSNSQVLKTSTMQKGYWKIQINWTSEGLGYYYEDSFFLN